MTENTHIPEEEQGLNVTSMDPDYDQGENINNAKATWEVQASREATWKHNTGEVYKHTSSAIDELISNSITAVLRAQRLFDVWDVGVYIQIDQKSEDEVYLTIRDEGVGMSESFIKNTLAMIGKKAGRAGEAANTKWGRGFYSYWMLVGEEKDDGSGSFVLSTNPRFEEDPDFDAPHNILCVPGEFPRVETHEAALDEDEYGTKIRFPIRDGISADELEQWVRDYATYSRMPIAFKRTYPDGTIENDELGGKNIEDNYSDEEPSVVIEEEGVFKAIASPEADGNVVVLDAKIETSSSLTLDLYSWWNIDIRLLNEDGAIYSSPDEEKVGKTPLPASEIEDVPQNKKDRYIAESQVNHNDLTLDEPSGTRDIMSLSDEFREHINKRLADELQSRIERILEKVDKIEDWDNLTDKESHLLGSIIKKRKNKWALQSIADNETIEMLNILSNRYNVIDEGSRITDRYDISRGKKMKKYVYEILCEYDNVYFGKSILQRRADAVWGAECGDYAVLQVQTSEYNTLEELGWEQITEIRSTTVEDELDVPQDIVDEFRNSVSRSSNNKSESSSTVSDQYINRNLTLHYKNYSRTSDVQVGNIREAMGDDVNFNGSLPNPSIERIVLFTSTSEHQISGNKTIVDKYTATASCVQRVYEKELKHLPNVIKYEDYNEHNSDYELLTNEGEMTISDITEREDIRFVRLGEPWYDYVKKTQKDVEFDYISRLIPEFDGLVVVSNKNDIYAIRNHINNLPHDTRTNSVSFSGNLKVRYKGTKLKLHNKKRRSRLINARFPEWDENTAELDFLRSVGGRDRIDSLAALHDRGIEPSSANEVEISQPNLSEIEIDTNEGRLSLQEIAQDDRRLVVYSLSEKVEPILGDIPIETVKSFIEMRHRGGSHYRKMNFYKDDYIFAVLSHEKCTEIAKYINNVIIARPKKASSVSNVKRNRKIDKYYTGLYAYHRSQENDEFNFNHIDYGKTHPLIESGYHYINSIEKSLEDVESAAHP